MKKFPLDISTKNIGYTHWNTYEKYFIESYEDLIQTMRWKLYHFKLKKRKKNSNTNEFYNNSGCSEKFYSLRTIAEAEVDLDLKSFQDDMIHLFMILKKRNFKSTFQDKIRDIQNRIKGTDKLWEYSPHLERI